MYLFIYFAAEYNQTKLGLYTIIKYTFFMKKKIDF